MTLSSAALTIALLAFFLLRTPEPDYARIQVATVEDLERELEALRVRLSIPGLSAAIAEGDRILWARGFGWANVERRVRVDPEGSSFHLASVTKPYAATVALQLEEERRLDLNALASTFDIGMFRGEPVRVWHLLSHSAGDPPGTAFRYDARAFGELTKVIERASGQPFAAALAERIVRRLDLKRTGPNPRPIDRSACRAQLSLLVLGACGSDDDAHRVGAVVVAPGVDRASLDAGLAQGYARQWGRQVWPAGLFGAMRPEQHLTELFASAGLVASATDVARFSMALDASTILNAETVKRAFTPPINGAGSLTFGLGWFLQEARGLSLAWQFGQSFESSSLLLKIPSRKVTFVALANSDGLSRRRQLGDHGDVLRSPAATLFLNWYAMQPRRPR